MSILIIAAILIPCFIIPQKNEMKNPMKIIRRLQSPVPEDEDLEFTEEEHRQLSRQFATEGMVLAINNGLPLLTTDKVVLFGLGSKNTVYGGWGSGQVYQKGTDSDIVCVKVEEGMKTKGDEKKIIFTENTKGYELGITNLTENDIKEFAKKDGTDAKRSVAVLTISRLSGEGMDRFIDDSDSGIKINTYEKNTYNALVKYFDKVVIVLNVGSVMEIPEFLGQSKTSILISFLPGMEAGNAIADVLVGDANPSGHLTDTWAKSIYDYSTTTTFLEDLEFVKYKEGMFMGYRYFEDDKEKQSKVVFPFGHGLSYTTFDIKSTCSFDDINEEFTVTSTVKNTGNRKGRQVVQVYAEKPQNEKFIKVKRELVAFAKTKDIEPGKEETLTMNFKLSYLASYDETGVTGNKACYVLEKGNYNIYVGDSVADVRGDKKKIYTYTQNELKVTEKLLNRLVPKVDDVKDANTKPKFEEFMKVIPEEEYKQKKEKSISLFKQQIKKYKAFLKSKEQKRKLKLANPPHKIPAPVINEINFKSVLEGNYTMKQLVDLLSDEELAYMSYGHDAKIKSGTGSIGGFYNADITGKYLVPGIETNDGPAGLRQSEAFLQSTAWPCSTQLASTFDVEVMEKVGNETGKEARKIGNSCWLAPGMNIHRNPLCGRNFEYYSEDPLLTGKMAAAITKGVQNKRVSITIKHFAFNDKEDNRGGALDLLASDSMVAERVAREIYLRGFEIAVKEGGAWSLMTSYNRVNGAHTGESYDLLTGILRNEWKFEGIVMTDWVASSNINREIHAGGNVKMPLNPTGSEVVYDALNSGYLSRKDLRRSVLQIFNTIAKTAAIDFLFKAPDVVNISSFTHVKVFDKMLNKYATVSYDVCNDEDGGYAPINLEHNSWITMMVTNDNDNYRHVKIRYAGSYNGFGVIFKKGEESLGEITNLVATGDGYTWKNSTDFTVKFPKGTYELTLHFLGYDYVEPYSNIKGHINWFEIEA